jgi:hypothetical protein
MRFVLGPVESGRDGAVAHEGTAKPVHGLEVRATVRRKGERPVRSMTGTRSTRESSMMVDRRSTERTPRSTWDSQLSERPMSWASLG